MSVANNYYDVMIIGGGASGLFCAAMTDGSKRVAVAEKCDRVGRKLLATGNGKCNLSNADMSCEHYNAPSFVKKYLDAFGVGDTLSFFDGIGLVTKEMDGRIYPYSECASSVLDALRKALRKKGVDILTDHRAVGVQRMDDGRYCVQFEGNRRYICKYLVLASGSDASFGEDSLGLYAPLGHKPSKRVPSLAPILTEREVIRGLNGIRAKVALTLNGKREEGEILFKDFGVSGIAAFDLSSEIARGRARVGDELNIDFMPDKSDEEARMLISRDTGAYDVLSGIFHSRLCERILDMAGVRPEASARENSAKLVAAIKRFCVKVVGISDKSLAQIMSGGLKNEEFDDRLMSVFSKNAFAIGEALDVDGTCGGYNLQWAWTSAAIVAKCINAMK